MRSKYSDPPIWPLQGRVIGSTICGKEDAFPGVVGATACKIFDYSVACAGTLEMLKKTNREVLVIIKNLMHDDNTSLITLLQLFNLNLAKKIKYEKRIV